MEFEDNKHLLEVNNLKTFFYILGIIATILTIIAFFTEKKIELKYSIR